MSRITDKQEKQNKKEFREKRRSQLTENVIILFRQSNERYKLIKNTASNTYYICRQKDKKTVEIGDKDNAEPFVLYGLQEMKEEVINLFK